MAKKIAATVQPSEFELQILGALWEHGSGTVRQVMDWIADGKPRAYTSVLSVMQVMQKKRLLGVEKEREGLAHVFTPLVTREQIVVPLLRGLVARVFGRQSQLAVQQLMDAEAAPGDEIEHLRNLLDELEARRSQPPKS